MQRNWIGRSTGVEFTLPYDPETSKRMADGKPGLKVFTTRADTIMGITFAAVAAEHPLAAEAAKGNPALAAFIEECKRGGVQEAELATMEKKGMPTGLHVLHPFTREKVVVWVGNYVLMGYGTGAIMSVPGHDTRDYEFAETFGLPVVEVISGGTQLPYVGDGTLVNSGFLDGLSVDEAKAKVIAQLEADGVGQGKIQYKLRDWLFARQRYWGEPFPIVYDADGNPVALPDSMLPELETKLVQRARELIAQHSGPIRSLTTGPLTETDFSYLNQFGLALEEGDCKQFRSAVDQFTTCRAMRLDGSSSQVPP
jgi:leucyl-tRNA synthetase